MATHLDTIHSTALPRYTAHKHTSQIVIPFLTNN